MRHRRLGWHGLVIAPTPTRKSRQLRKAEFASRGSPPVSLYLPEGVEAQRLVFLLPKGLLRKPISSRSQYGEDTGKLQRAPRERIGQAFDRAGVGEDDERHDRGY